MHCKDMNAITLNDVSKMYRVYAKPSHKLKEGLIRGVFRSRRSYHREFWALRDVQLSIPRGVTMGVVGQNGAGKSTLLQVISGILQPTIGSVQVSGRIAALLELGAGFSREFTGRENVFMNGAILGLSRKEMEERMDAIAAFADIGQFMDQPVKIYSSGMYIRLAFATAVHLDPDILIIDEALAVGDMLFQRKCYRRMEEFQKAGKTILVVSHVMQTIRSFCSHAVLLDGGRILEEGTPNQIVNAYNKLMASREEIHGSGRRDDRLDQPGMSSSSEEGDEFRYGQGGAELTDFAVLDAAGLPAQILEAGKPFRVRGRVRFDRDVKQPLMGMVVKTMTGIQVYGTTTKHMGTPIGPVEAGMRATVEFEQICRLTPGTYRLSLGVSEETETHLRPLDRRLDAVVFRVIGDETVFGLIDNEVKVRTIEKEHARKDTVHLP